MGGGNLRPLDTRPAENDPIFLKAVRLHGRPPARPFGFEKTRHLDERGVNVNVVGRD